MAKSLRPGNVTHDDLANMSVIVDYEDGSIGNLQYLTQGGIKVPKEFLEVFGSDKTVQLHNFEYLMIYEGTDQRKYKSGGLDKGQSEEMKMFITAIKDNKEMPISLESIFDTTLVTLAAEESLRTGNSVQLADYFKLQD